MLGGLGDGGRHPHGTLRNSTFWRFRVVPAPQPGKAIRPYRALHLPMFGSKYGVTRFHSPSSD